MSNYRISIAKSLLAHTIARSALLVTAAAFVILSTAKSFAAQITLAFDATVTEVNGASEFIGVLPFVPAVGQAITGQVTFTPVPFGQMSENDAKLELAWVGQTFTGVSNTLVTRNDNFGPLFSPVDSLSLSCGVSQGCITSSYPITLRELVLVLKSFQNVLPGGQLMDSVEGWNKFDDRQLLFSFSNANDTMRMGVNATVGAMRVAPEPRPVTFLLAGVFLIGLRITSLRSRTWQSIGLLLSRGVTSG